MKKAFAIFFFATFFVHISSQINSSDCLTDFDYIVKKVREDYPGYSDKITKNNLPKLMELEKTLRNKIEKHPDSCVYYFKQYTDFFKDYHLNVRRSFTTSARGQNRPKVLDTSSYGRNISLTSDMLNFENSTALEGLWESALAEFAIIRDEQKFIAVAIEGKDWDNRAQMAKGFVKYEFQPINDSTFDVIIHTNIEGRKKEKTKASLHLENKILEIHNNFALVRASDSTILDRATLATYIPEHPNGSNTYFVSAPLGDSTFYIRIPTFGSDYSNQFVLRNWNQIINHPNLIIDIRNNGGGQDINYQELAKIIYTKPIIFKGVEWLASEGNIKYFEDAIKNGEIKEGKEWMKWTTDLIEAMKENIGDYVIHPNHKKIKEIVQKDTIYPNPRNIGIIINEGNASSAEQFLLTAQQSDKVILFGKNNTAGVLDYSNVTPTKTPSGKYEIWCPMTRSRRLPKNPIDNIGIAPDVRIPLPAAKQLYDRLDDWAYFVQKYLELLE
ncbi:S41 family peptidase [Dysgonomonas massiliensis]|uniref:S41 family peptidase n=1 Tax=Dysgonomonas massiliensis TaxID=2040292 RepID=UPI000C767A9E|nr:S41 family peptidase [Dysgonomonas massiliensis]